MPVFMPLFEFCGKDYNSWCLNLVLFVIGQEYMYCHFFILICAKVYAENLVPKILDINEKAIHNLFYTRAGIMHCNNQKFTNCLILLC